VDGEHASLRRLVTDMVGEYGRHAGHADLPREAVDGLAGGTRRTAGGRNPAATASRAGPRGGEFAVPGWSRATV
jgi:hypothetical protein